MSRLVDCTVRQERPSEESAPDKVCISVVTLICVFFIASFSYWIVIIVHHCILYIILLLCIVSCSTLSQRFLG